MFTSRNDPARRLYERVMRNKCKHGLTEHRVSLSAITHFVNGREIASLREKETDFFEWGDHWSVPEH
jgi:hypothetical protein